MSKQISLGYIDEILRQLGLVESRQRVLLVGAVFEDKDIPHNHDIIQVGHVGSASEISDEIRVDIAVVVDQVECMSKTNGMHLLSKLRDLTSTRVLLLLSCDNWTSGELLALGFQEIQQQAKRPSNDGRLYLFDPNDFHESREWNNTVNWANPENFNKFRW
jgi:hypothetical protein